MGIEALYHLLESDPLSLTDKKAPSHSTAASNLSSFPRQSGSPKAKSHKGTISTRLQPEAGLYKRQRLLCTPRHSAELGGILSVVQSTKKDSEGDKYQQTLPQGQKGKERNRENP